jgi:tol-pal system protein YbgF
MKLPGRRTDGHSLSLSKQAIQSGGKKSMKPLTLTLCSFIAGCLLWGCATQSDVRILEDRIIALERRNMELQEQTSEAVSAKHQMKTQLEEKEQALRNQSAGISATTDELKNEIQTLNGRIDELNYRIAQNNNEMKTIEQRTAVAERQLNIETPPQQAPTPYSPPEQTLPEPSNTESSGNQFQPEQPVSPPSASDSPVPDMPDASDVIDENQLYTEGRQRFENGNYSQARKKFQQLIQQFPNAQFADNAQFWIGESYYKERNYEQAILEYQAVIEKYPNGNKVRASLLKQGFAFNNMGDTANSRLILQDLIDKYPNSSEAIIAGQKLNSL